ncbi:serine hydrolase domain-containing protein [Spongiactinospora rosea]|nr:serine hydrolase domain-containing protein [Spongiactinospora rosea]
MIRQPSRRSALGLMGAIPVAGALPAALTSRGRTPRELAPGGEYDEYIAALAAKDEFSGTILLAHRGETVLARAYGMADKARSIPNRVGTIFNLASASKPFTALAIMQLVARDKVKLHETLGTYLDGFPPESAGHVTVHQMLTHTCGLGDFQLDQEYQDNAETWTTEATTMDGIMAAVRRTPPKYTPGTRYEYSSSGIAVLGAIVARVSGQSYYDYVREHIFTPAGMTRTDFFDKPRWEKDARFAHPYWHDQAGRPIDGLHRPPPPLPSGHRGFAPYIGNPGGGGFSTAGDLVRLDRALRRGRLLDAAYTELFMTLKHPTPPASPSVQVTGSAYGLIATMYDHRWLAGHGGSMVAGGTTNWTIYRDLHWTGVILTNYSKTDIRSIMNRERSFVTRYATRPSRE